MNDPMTQLQLFNLTQYAGIAGAPAIEQAVQYLKEQWKLPVKLAPVAALVLGVLLNVAIAAYVGNSLQDAVLIGLMTGAAASSWYIVSK